METLDWYYSLPEEKRANPPMAITPEKEAEVLAAWKARG
jgi:2'-hydroxyisoflavone reductase